MSQRFHDVLLKAKGDFKKKGDLEVAKLISRNTLQDFAETHLNPGQLGALVAFNCGHGLRLVEFAIQDFQPELKNTQMWFCSMGSGQPITDPFLAFIKRALFQGARPKLNEGVFVAYWTLRHAIELNTGGILGPPQIATLSKSSPGKVCVKLLSEQDFGEPQGMVDGAEEQLKLYREKLAGKEMATNTTTPPPALPAPL